MIFSYGKIDELEKSEVNSGCLAQKKIFFKSCGRVVLPVWFAINFLRGARMRFTLKGISD